MNKTFLHRYSTILIGLDVLTISISLIIAYLIRFNTIIPQAEHGLAFSYFKIGIILTLVTIYMLYREGQYLWNRPKSILHSQVYSLLSSISIFYFFKGNKVSRFTIALYFVFSTILFIINRRLIKKCITIPHCLLIGDSPLLEHFKMRSEKQTFTALNDVNQIKSLNFSPDNVVISFKENQDEKVALIMDYFSSTNANIHIIPYYKYDLLKNELSENFGMPILTVNTNTMSWITTVQKRIFDIIFSITSLILLLPILLIISTAVKLTSKGPIFYRQQRMGIDGLLFTMWKFRSMKIDAEKETGAVWAKENDPRITPIGSFLRRTSLDEIPQFWNVLIGQMSIVGPRPERPELIGKFRHEIPAYMLRHRMKAGITGWAQINGLRGNCDLGERIQADLYYIKNWSFWLDIKIIWLTVYREIIKKVL